MKYTSSWNRQSELLCLWVSEGVKEWEGDGNKSVTNKTRHGKTRYKTWILKYNITNKTNKRERIECYINVFFIRMYLQLSTDGDSTLTFVKMHIANNMPLKLNGGILAKAATPHTHTPTHPAIQHLPKMWNITITEIYRQIHWIRKRFNGFYLFGTFVERSPQFGV